MLNTGNATISFTLLMIAAASRFCAGATLDPPKDMSFKADVDGTEQFYMEMLPGDFDKDQKHDLILGLHGHGSDRKQFATDGRPECSSFRAFAAKHGMIAVTPDYRAPTSWMGPKAEADMVQIIGDLKMKYKINRVFIVGASMGGTSVLTFAALHTDIVDGVTSMNGHANHVEYNQFQAAIAESFGGPKNKMRKTALRKPNPISPRPKLSRSRPAPQKPKNLPSQWIPPPRQARPEFSLPMRNRIRSMLVARLNWG